MRWIAWLAIFESAHKRSNAGDGTIRDISYTVHTFKEGKTYVTYVPELDVSSCGSTDDEARKNIRTAVEGFLQTCEEMGTLDEILQEAGYEPNGNTWRAPEFVALDRFTASVK